MNTYLKGFSKAIIDYGHALRFIFKNGFGWYFLVPIALNILLFTLGFWAINDSIEYLKLQVLEYTELTQSDAWFAEFLSWMITGTIWLVLKVAFFFMFAYLGGYVVVICMSPALAYLSESVEKIFTQQEYPFDIQQLMRDVVRGVLIALRNMFLELLIIAVFFFVSMIPLFGWVVSLLSPFILLLVSAYFYGFSFTDYVIERQRLNLKQSVGFMRSNKGIITGNGLPFALILLIPFIGVTLSGFMAIISTVASVISIYDHLDELPMKQLKKHE